MRIVELPAFGVKFIRKLVDPALSRIFVAVQEADAPIVFEVEFGVPAPARVNPTPLTEILLAQVQVPAGMLITSPSTTLCSGPLMRALTSD
jgi:hypothetical protein